MNELEYIKNVEKIVNGYIRNAQDMILDFHDSLLCFQTDFEQTSQKFHEDIIDLQLKRNA